MLGRSTPRSAAVFPPDISQNHRGSDSRPCQIPAFTPRTWPANSRHPAKIGTRRTFRRADGERRAEIHQFEEPENHCLEYSANPFRSTIILPFQTMQSLKNCGNPETSKIRL